jgi:medium-chain acyl-[acyl-carrier-protein] hydrolase
MTLPESFQFSKTFEVGSYQVKPDGNISLTSMADMFQEIAWAHADSADFGRNLSEMNLMWALARLEIEIKEFPNWGQKIQLFTGSKGADKLFAFRDFMIWDEDERVLARGMSSWLLLNSTTKRIQKPEAILPVALFDPTMKPDRQPPKLVAYGEVVASEDLRVRFSDLDLNYHVNNTSYIRWVENILADQEIYPSSLAINFVAECHKDDLVSLKVFQGSRGGFIEGRVFEKLVFTARF